jgi:hypothetical protein
VAQPPWFAARTELGTNVLIRTPSEYEKRKQEKVFEELITKHCVAITD